MERPFICSRYEAILTICFRRVKAVQLRSYGLWRKLLWSPVAVERRLLTPSCLDNRRTTVYLFFKPPLTESVHPCVSSPTTESAPSAKAPAVWVWKPSALPLMPSFGGQSRSLRSPRLRAEGRPTAGARSWRGPSRPVGSTGHPYWWPSWIGWRATPTSCTSSRTPVSSSYAATCPTRTTSRSRSSPRSPRTRRAESANGQEPRSRRGRREVSPWETLRT